MKIISKFHTGMIKASALSVLYAIDSNNGKAIIAKSAKLVLLATKLNIVLHDALPNSVMLVITNVLNKLAMKAKSEHIKEAVTDVAFCFLFRTTYLANRADYETLASLLTLPKLSALR